MKTRKFCLAVILGSILSGFNARSQDMNYSQYFSAPMYFNPATTGLNTGLRARFLFRNQWPSLPVSYKSYYFSADIGDRGLPGAGGIGLTVQSNNDGVAFIHDLSVGLNIAVRVPITSYMISQVGIRASIGQRRVNWADFVWPDQLSELYGNVYVSSIQLPESNKKVYPDFGVGGLLLFTNEGGSMTGTAGLAIDHLFQPDIAFLSTGAAPLMRKWVANADLVFTSGGGSPNMSYGGGGDPLKVNPGIIYQNQNGMSALQVGLNILKFNIYLGGWYKSTLGTGPNSNMVLLAGYRYVMNEQISLRAMYSYDMQVSGNLSGTGGAHEISLVLEFGSAALTSTGRSENSGGVFTSGGRGGRNYGHLECPSFY